MVPFQEQQAGRSPACSRCGKAATPTGDGVGAAQQACDEHVPSTHAHASSMHSHTPRLQRAC
eukprot:62444-Chlamydomonas_euryale.AAC.1